MMLDILSAMALGDYLGRSLGQIGLEFWQNVSRDLFLNVGKEYINSNRFWQQVERREVESLKGKEQRFCSNNCQLDRDVIAHFGSATPDAKYYLLHYAPGWDSNRNTVPLLLLHGAGLDATSFCDVFALGYTGLQQQLVELGYKVFAVSFPHPHGDNYLQAIQLADAISRVRELTRAPQVDILAHSKGGLATWIYLAGLASTPYQGEVRRYIMLGTPNGGTDFAFRNPLFNYLIYISGSNGPMAWDQILSLGSLVDCSEQAIYHDGCFPGQNQMLARWDEEFAPDPLQQDWWTTYYGGSGLISHSRGIDAAIKDGEYCIQKLNRHGLPPGLEFSVLAGDKHFLNCLPGEACAPSDGLVLVDSVLCTDGLMGEGARLLDKDVMPVNHMELLYARRVARWIDRQLRD